MTLRDETSREAFVDEHYERLYAWLWWLSGSPETAADLVQETFAGFWVSLDRIDVRRPRVWLYRIARNRWRKWCRDSARRRSVAADPDALLDSEPDPAESTDRAELARAAVAAVAALPPLYREAMTLRYWADLPYDEIGRVVGIPASLARWRVHRGRHLVRDAVERSTGTMGGEA
ncbi:MAG: RNA polymerase sigma factor [Planctomycetota bacterium]